jgi:hypothetical protein
MPYDRKDKLSLIADMVGSVASHLSDVYNMPADGLSIGEAFQILNSTQRIQKTVDNTQRWLHSLANPK